MQIYYSLCENYTNNSIVFYTFIFLLLNMLGMHFDCSARKGYAISNYRVETSFSHAEQVNENTICVFSSVC